MAQTTGTAPALHYQHTDTTHANGAKGVPEESEKQRQDGSERK